MHIGYNFIILCFLFLLVACNKDDDAITQPINPSINNDEAKHCSNAQRYDEVLKKCVNICTENEFFDITTEDCRKTMPNPIEEKICQGDLALDKVTSKCACFGRSKEDPINKNCVCEAGAHYSKIDADCVCYNQDKFYNPLYSRCTLFCKEGEELFMLSNGEFQLCVPKCKSGYFYDLSESMCIQKCEGNSYRNRGDAQCTKGKMLSINPEYRIWSILPLLTVDRNPGIYLNIDPRNQPTEEDINKRIKMIKSAINAWLEPLRSSGLGGERFVRDIEVSTDRVIYNSNNVIATVDLLPTKRAYAINSLSRIAVSLSSELGTYIHEFGHLLGFEDLYDQDPHSRLRRLCLTGYDETTTIMCFSSDPFLRSADIEGIQNLYCRFFQNEDPEACAVLQQRLSLAAISSLM
ncbi:MAG: hypothetical protein HQK53_11965 [Oligoflexia bacterium]|nr:hypothetical protein [Oligoflexia bacterium]